MRTIVASSFALAVFVGPALERCVGNEVLNIAEPFDARAIDAERLRVQNRLRKALETFDAQVAENSPATQKDWRAYLAWNDWAGPALEGGAWNPSAMQRISKRLYAAEEGFEHPIVVELRSALSAYLAYEEAVKEANGDLEGEYQRRVSLLRQTLRSNEADYADVETAAWWLAATRQAPETLAQVHAQFSGPVIIGQIHRDLVEAKLDAFQGVSRLERQTRHRIQGVLVAGASSVVTTTTAELIDADDARLRIVAAGSVRSPHNVSTSGRVRVASSAQSEFTVSADVYWDGEQFATTSPQATASTRSTIKGIDAPRLIRRAAARRVYGGRRAAESEAESLVERQAAESMSARMSKAINKLNQKPRGFLQFLTRTGNAAHRWQTRVTDDAVHIGYLPTSLAGIGARPHVMPPLEGDETLGLSFHDAAIEGILRAQVAGAVWTDVNFATLQRELTGGNSEEMMIGLEPGRWSAQWSWRHPVRIHFSPAGATVRYQFSHVEIDGSGYEVPFEVRAEMHASATPLGHEMRTRAPATVESLDAKRPLPPHFQTFLERKFRGLFRERFYLDGLQFPAGGHLDAMSRFHSAGVQFEQNWVHLRYSNRQSATTQVARDDPDGVSP